MGYGDEILRTTNKRRKLGLNTWANWYLNSADTEGRRFYFNMEFRARPGHVSIKPEISTWARDAVASLDLPGFLLLEPNTKQTVMGLNKQWPYERWQELADRLELPVVQCVYESARVTLTGVHVIQTPSFWHAVAVLRLSAGAVLPDGGLHHAAGALGHPAVVIWGGYTPPEILDYVCHENIHEPDPECFGRMDTHPACLACMDRISVDRVLEACHATFEVHDADTYPHQSAANPPSKDGRDAGR